MTARPRLILEVSWTTNPTAPPAWVDESWRVRELTVGRGRQRDLDRFEAGRLAATLDNRDGFLDPLNLAAPAPYLGNLLPRRRVRSRAEYPWVGPGGFVPLQYQAAGEQPPDAGAASFVGAGTEGWQLSPFTTTPHTMGAVVVPAAERWHPYLEDAYRFARGVPTSGATELAYLWLRVDPSLVGGLIQFTARARALDEAGASMSLSADSYNAGRSAPVNSSSGPAVAAPVAGKWVRIAARAALVTGTGWVRFRFTSSPAATPGARYELQAIASEYLPLGPGLTFAGLAGASGPVDSYLFTGYADRWRPRWEGRDAVVVLEATDAYKVLAGTPLPRSAHEVEVNRNPPTHRWRAGEDAGAAQLGDSGSAALTSLAVVRPTSSASRVDTGAAGIGPAGAPSSGLQGFAELTTPGAANTTPMLRYPSAVTGDFLLELGLVQRAVNETTVVFGRNVVEVRGASGDYAGLGLIDAGDHVNAKATLTGSLAGVTFQTAGTAFAKDTIHHVAMTRVGDLFTVYLDGFTAGTLTRALPATLDLNVNAVSYLENDYTRVSDLLLWTGAAASAAIASGMNNRRQAYLTGYSGEDSGTRVGRIADLVGWPAGDRSIDTGSSLLQAAAFGRSALAALQLVADSELGGLYMLANGSLRFRARQSVLKPPYTTVQATFGDALDGVEVPYERLEASFGDDKIVNSAARGREGGPVQYVQDQASIDAYWQNGHEQTDLNNLSDEDVRDAAAYIVDRYRAPTYDLTSLVLAPLEPLQVLQLLARELEDRVRVRKRPPGGVLIDQEALIQGVQHRITPSSWRSEWWLSPADVRAFMVLDDSVAGRLDYNRVAF